MKQVTNVSPVCCFLCNKREKEREVYLHMFVGRHSEKIPKNSSKWLPEVGWGG